RYETEIYIGPHSRPGSISIFILRKPNSAELLFRRTDSVRSDALLKDERYKKLMNAGFENNDFQVVTDIVMQHMAYSTHHRKLRAREPFVAALDSFYTFDKEFLSRNAKSRYVLD